MTAHFTTVPVLAFTATAKKKRVCIFVSTQIAEQLLTTVLYCKTTDSSLRWHHITYIRWIKIIAEERATVQYSKLIKSISYNMFHIQLVSAKKTEMRVFGANPKQDQTEPSALSTSWCSWGRLRRNGGQVILCFSLLKGN
jgi:hypothetical protein